MRTSPFSHLGVVLKSLIFMKLVKLLHTVAISGFESSSKAMDIDPV
jgi:hypothetical protein